MFRFQQFLPDFLLTFPLNKALTVDQNYNGQTDTTTQASRGFISSKTVAENYKIYDAFFGNQWVEILTTLNTPTLAAISATKNAEQKLKLPLAKILLPKRLLWKLALPIRANSEL